MGKDIHLLTEIKKNNLWQPIEEVPDSYDCRNYNLFEILENYGHMGIPEELKDKKFRYNEEYSCWEFDFTDECLFHHAYMSLPELEHYIFDLNKIKVSPEFLDKFFELGGVLPDGMSLDLDNKSNDYIYIQVMDEDEEHVIECLKAGIKELKEIAKKYNVNDDEIRIIYAFDW